MALHDLDNPDRYGAIRDRIRKKRSLELLYREVYSKYKACLEHCPSTGIAVELGAGAGFAREVLPAVIASDILPYPGLDLCFDALQFPLADRSVRAILMYNVFHHIAAAGTFLSESQRVLMPGGRLLIVDEYPGYISTPVLKYLHHEGYDANGGWSFDSSGPLSGANGALSWIVFERDRVLFESRYPGLKLQRYEPHTPLRYWLAGGLKPWSLLPPSLFQASSAVDQWLARILPKACSFVDIEIVRQEDSQ